MFQATGMDRKMQWIQTAPFKFTAFAKSCHFMLCPANNLYIPAKLHHPASGNVNTQAGFEN
jgi:hypothetical protein